MTYEQFLFSHLLSAHIQKYRHMECDLQYSKAIELYNIYIHSEHFMADAAEYECQEAWIMENKHLV